MGSDRCVPQPAKRSSSNCIAFRRCENGDGVELEVALAASSLGCDYIGLRRGRSGLRRGRFGLVKWRVPCARRAWSHLAMIRK